MYAVFESGGKQHRVKEGEILKLEKIEAATGDTIEFERVLLLGEGAQVQVGQPLLEGARVSAEVLAQGRHDKIHIIKFKRRKHHMKRTGHRQWYTEVKVTGISA
jgi:large subunit ribosomal protein L21